MQSNVETRVTDVVATDNQSAGSEAEASPPSPSAPLTEAEAVQYETLVTRFKKLEDHWVESMRILAEIRNQRLYRASYGTFEEFCHKELRMSRANVDRQCQTLEIVRLLPTNVVKPVKESHVRPLLRLKSGGQRIEAYQKVVAEAAAKKKRITGGLVTRVVNEILKPETPDDAAPKVPTKGDVITRITRDIARDLEKRPMEQLEEFEKAVVEFKAAWLSDHPAGDEAPATKEGEKSE